MLDGNLKPVNASQSTTVPSSTAHVLVIDDDPSIRQMIADYLGDNDIRVTALDSGREIDRVMAQETIYLLILDL